MPVSVKLPALGESVTEGTVTRWLKQEGDQVEADEPLLEVSTDKVDTEIPSPASGTLSKIVVAEDETVEVGAELAIINDGGSGDAEPAAAPAEEPAAEEPSPEPSPEAKPEAEAPAQEKEPAAEPEPAPAASGGGDGARTPVNLPALGESVTEGTVTRWLKQVGDSVEVDEPLLEVSTDKVDTEIPSPVAGTLLEITVGEDETAPVGAQLAVVGTSDGAAPAPAPEAPKQEAPKQEAPKQEAPKQEAPKAPAPQDAPRQEAPAAQAPAQQTSNGDASGAYVTPLVRKLAAEHNVDLSSVNGTGVGGRIRKQDILDAAAKAKEAAAKPAPAAAAAAPSTAPAPSSAGKVNDAAAALRGKTEPLSRIRKLIAKRMVQSLQTAAQLTTVVEVDVTKIAKLRQQAKNDFLAREGVKLSFLPFFALATVEALRQHALLNATWDDEETVTYHDAEHLGIAVDSPRGLVVPVIHNAGDLNLAGLARKIADLAERVRTNKASPDELGGGSFTLTNTGSRGALFDTPILNQPQVGMLGTGAVVKRAVVVDDEEHGEIIVPRSMVYLALTYDHRLVDGADAARFLVTIKERLEGGAFQSELGLS
jgi:2-oxoglutarate dehydrogenase E2 component (dihydrolipoamide succinyltransferase)